MLPNQEPGRREPPRSTWYEFFEGGPLPPGSWQGNIVNGKPPQNTTGLSTKTTNFLSDIPNVLGSKVTVTAATAILDVHNSREGAVPLSLPGHDNQAATPLKSTAWHPCPLAATGSPTCETEISPVPAAAPPVLLDHLQVEEPLYAVTYAPPTNQAQKAMRRESHGTNRRRSSPKTNRRSSMFMAIIEESIIEDAPVLCVLELPGLQADRARLSLCLPMPAYPKQSFFIKDLQCDWSRWRQAVRGLCMRLVRREDMTWLSVPINLQVLIIPRSSQPDWRDARKPRRERGVLRNVVRPCQRDPWSQCGLQRDINVTRTFILHWNNTNTRHADRHGRFS